MKLIGSKAEEELRRELLSPRNAIFFGDYSKVGAFLKTPYPKLKTAYVLNHTPEQGEDIFLVLVNTDTLTRIGLSKNTESPRRACCIIPTVAASTPAMRSRTYFAEYGMTCSMSRKGNCWEREACPRGTTPLPRAVQLLQERMGAWLAIRDT